MTGERPSRIAALTFHSASSKLKALPWFEVMVVARPGFHAGLCASRAHAWHRGASLSSVCCASPVPGRQALCAMSDVCELVPGP